MKQVAIFASGMGSNFEKLVDNQKLADVMTVHLLVCDNPTATVIEKARSRNIPVLVFNPKEFSSKKEYETMILEHVKNCDLLLLAGYMRVISPYFLNKYSKPIVNLHPSLLPAYKGKDAIKQAFEAGEQMMGISVHYVNEELDGGVVIAQTSLQRDSQESLDEITSRIHGLEHELFPRIVYQLLTKED